MELQHEPDALPVPPSSNMNNTGGSSPVLTEEHSGATNYNPDRL